MGAGGVKALCVTKTPPALCKKHNSDDRKTKVNKFTSAFLPEMEVDTFEDGEVILVISQKL